MISNTDRGSLGDQMNEILISTNGASRSNLLRHAWNALKAQVVVGELLVALR